MKTANREIGEERINIGTKTTQDQVSSTKEIHLLQRDRGQR